MTESISTREFIDRLVQQSGIKKKLATEILRMIPEIIEEGLKRDGEVKVKGLGTFRMKWTLGRIGRNPKTGQEVEIPPHNRLVFLPEQSLKEYINRDYRLLGYKVVPAAGPRAEEENINPEYEPVIEPLHEIPVAAEHRPELEMEPLPTVDEPVLQAEEIDYNYEPGTLPVKRKRRVHWIVPVAIGVIAVLSVLFYFRNFNPVLKKSEESREKAYIVTRDSVDSQQLADTVKSEKFKVQSEETVIPAPQPVSRNPEPRAQNSTSPINDSTLRIQNSEGKHLFQLARETYGNPFLWVLIYKANLDKIPDPDVVISGKELMIPSLEGKPRKLSHNDSLEVAEGYRLVYEFYKARGDSRAEDFHRTSKQFAPE